MDKKALAGIGIIAVGGIAVFMMSRSDSGPMPGAGSGGGGAPPPETKKESQGSQGYEAPVFNINFPEPNFPSVPQIDYGYILDNYANENKNKKSNYYVGPTGLIYSGETNEKVSGQFGAGKPRGWSMGVNLETGGTKVDAPVTKKSTNQPVYSAISIFENRTGLGLGLGGR